MQRVSQENTDNPLVSLQHQLAGTSKAWVACDESRNFEYPLNIGICTVCTAAKAK
jgi:hypothetical protein